MSDPSELTNVDPNASVEVTVKSGKHEVCEATLFKWNTLPCDMVVEHEVDLKFPAKERTKNSPADISTRVLGSIKLRVILTKGSGSQDPCPMWTSLSTTAPTGTAFTECQFFDTEKSLRKSVKTGDLIVFQDSGLPGHLMNLATNSSYSRVGMVLRIPDKYTGRVRPFVVELTSNLQEFIDVSSELPRAGIVLFRLWERLHSVQGGSIWLLPLLEPIANDPLGNLIDFAQKTISQGSSTPESLTSVPSADILAFLQDLGIKDSLNYREVNSAAVCASLLRMGGKRPTEPQIVHSRATPKDPSGRDAYAPSPFMTPAALVGQTDLFGPLIPLRLMKSSQA
jgi:hypothetical protein